MNRKPMFSAAAALLAGVTLVAGAVSPAMAHSDPAKKQEETAATAKTKAERKYCANTELTASRIRIMECHTREVWIERYQFDPLEALNKR